MEATATTETTDSNMLNGWNSNNRFVSSSEQSSCKRLKTCDAALLSTATKETTKIPTLGDIPSELFIRHILPFVGDHQYRFVAAVNRNFHTAYVTIFPKKVTRFNVSTIEHAKICFDENKDQYDHQRMLCNIAAGEGNLSVLKYLRSIQCDCDWDESTCSNAALNGHLEVIKWCRKNRCPWDVYTCANAAQNGHLDILKWCRKNRCPWTQSTCWNAAENGHLDVIKWCCQNGCPLDSLTCANAAKNGHLDVIKWCCQNGCPLDSQTCANAAKNGHLDVIQWCRQNGCPWDSRICANAAGKGHLDVVKWCRENGCPWTFGYIEMVS
jgi:hypothetical protein